MRTTLDIPQDLIERVMSITEAKTKSEAIRIALQRLIEHQKRIKLIKFRGKIDLNLDLDSLRDRS